MNLPGGKKLIGAAIGIIIIVFLAHRLIWHRPPVPVIAVKKVEVQGTVHGPGTVQSKVPVTVSAKITGILEKLYADQGERVKKASSWLNWMQLNCEPGKWPPRPARTAPNVIWPGLRPI